MYPAVIILINMVMIAKMLDELNDMKSKGFRERTDRRTAKTVIEVQYKLRIY